MKALTIILAVLIVAFGLLFWFFTQRTEAPIIDDTIEVGAPSKEDDDLTTKNPVTRDPSLGLVDPVYINASSDDIRLEAPSEGGTMVRSSFTVSGEARGSWFFEADFPIEVLDGEGNSLTMSYASAEGDWMTESFVPFTGEVTVENYSGPAVLVLHKDNPSGLPERDASLLLPIVIQ